MPLPELKDALSRLRQAAEAGLQVADEPAGKALLRSVGVSTPEGRVVSTPAQASVAAAELGGAVGLKIVAPGLAHKTDVDGVCGPLWSGEAVRQAATDMLGRMHGELLVERWETGAAHCFVGLALRGPLGPVVSVGIGGIWVEILRDVGHRAAPVTAEEAAEALLSLRGAPLLRGGRGRPPVDVGSLGEAVAQISRLVLSAGVRELVEEIDVNPLLARTTGAPVALDCTVVLVGGRQGRPQIPAGVAAGVTS